MSSIILSDISGFKELTLSNKVPTPSFGFTSSSLNIFEYFLKTSLRKILTTCPKIIGSLTFIIVALRCNERSNPLFLASIISFCIKSTKASFFNTEASITSPF